MKGTLAIFSTLLVLSSAALVENDLSNIAENDLSDTADKTQVQTHKKRGHFGSHSLRDVIAQSSCSAYMPNKPDGWVYAVRRACISRDSCADVCKSKFLQSQDQQTASKTWRCIGTVHVYQKRPVTGDGRTPTLGLKTRFYGYENCNSAGRCGPNYCCCKVSRL